MIAFRVVIVDDDPDDRGLLRDAFEAAGIEPVFAFSSVEPFLQYLFSVKESGELPVLVVTDVNMPGMTGFELLKRLKLTPRFCTIPVVVWSTSNDVEEMNRALRFGAASCVVKPVRMSEYNPLIPRMLHCV
ncbi:response regulator [Flavisolibacter ginsenosidimutans]|uniref:Response regulator n=1 Tax=Flavisolibacter ginsenosidimutans TaxID=661481 RepID=A0A5B8UKK5_9BACT|nr:response regulator [Flavisolibacter ginsenosidimutans]QEC56709.1 response regulator [Flavisolibacter ginsenosidimutans]